MYDDAIAYDNDMPPGCQGCDEFPICAGCPEFPKLERKMKRIYG